jgi:uncharacterized ferredoxin-like protein
MLAGLLKKIAKAGGKANIKSEASAARNAVRKNPKMTGKKEDDAITKINNAEKAAKNKITNRGRAAAQEGARKRYVNPDPAKRKQSPQERETSAIGRVSAKTTTQRNKKEGVGSMVSYTSMERAAAMRKAKRELEEGRITQEEYDRIIKAIDRANEREVSKAGRQSRTPTTREAPFPIPAKAKGVKGLNMNKGGYANCGASMKATQKSTNMAYGGMARKK